MGTRSSMLQQVNVRLDPELKRRAEEVLALMGSSATELIRSSYEKVARGAGDYAEAMEVLKGSGQQPSQLEDKLGEGWSICDEFYRSQGLDPAADELDDRPWDEVYAEAMTSHFREKGVM